MGPSRETWSARYEQLRLQWTRQEVGWGQALLIHQGMVAWMKAWPEETRSQTSGRDNPLETAPSPSNAIRGELHRQLTRELANLIFHHQQEALA